MSTRQDWLCDLSKAKQAFTVVLVMESSFDEGMRL